MGICISVIMERSIFAMKSHPTIGFPRMMKEQSERRVFLPEFIFYLSRLGPSIYIEEGYGSRSGFCFDDYHQASDNIFMCSREEAFQQDIVIILRAPFRDELKLIPPDTVLLSMLHFPTRPLRVNVLHDLGIKAISMDSIVNDSGIRLVENMRAVAWNGIEAAFDVLELNWPELEKPDRKPIQVLVFGTGMVGKHAVDAATKLGNIERNNQHMKEGKSGAVALAVGRNISGKQPAIEELFRSSDVLVDATQRRNTSLPIIPNSWIDWLPEHAVITDLAVDPYILEAQPAVVRGIEGIPQGDLSHYFFPPGDPQWNQSVPASIPSTCRRSVVSCYSWPGIHPEACMRHYAQQLLPLVEVLLIKGYDNLSVSGDYFERALSRGTLRAFLSRETAESTPRLMTGALLASN
jgi:alanine dehydrogenase